MSYIMIYKGINNVWHTQNVWCTRWKCIQAILSYCSDVSKQVNNNNNNNMQYLYSDLTLKQLKYIFNVQLNILRSTKPIAIAMSKRINIYILTEYCYMWKKTFSSDECSSKWNG